MPHTEPLMPKRSQTPPTPTPWGLRLRALRGEKRLSQNELADLAGVPRPWLSNVETGVIVNPQGLRLQLVAEALEVTPRYILTGNDDVDSDDDPVRQFESLPRRIQRQVLRLAAAMLEPTDPEARQQRESQQQREHPAGGGEQQADDGPAPRDMPTLRLMCGQAEGQI